MAVNIFKDELQHVSRLLAGSQMQGGFPPDICFIPCLPFEAGCFAVPSCEDVFIGSLPLFPLSGALMIARTNTSPGA